MGETSVTTKPYRTIRIGNLAERSKALESGVESSPSGREFESHSCQYKLIPDIFALTQDLP